jgi:hypothetical protein
MMVMEEEWGWRGGMEEGEVNKDIFKEETTCLRRE